MNTHQYLFTDKDGNRLYNGTEVYYYGFNDVFRFTMIAGIILRNTLAYYGTEFIIVTPDGQVYPVYEPAEIRIL